MAEIGSSHHTKGGIDASAWLGAIGVGGVLTMATGVGLGALPSTLPLVVFVALPVVAAIVGALVGYHLGKSRPGE